jgi:hypothetical protein
MNPIFPNLLNSTARGLFVVLLAIFLLAESYAQDSKKPNIVVILADDLGWMDLASYAARVRGVDRTECYYETPNLDRLADQGLSFSQAYACPLCSPARASILTGQYAARHGLFMTARRTAPRRRIRRWVSLARRSPMSCSRGNRKISTTHSPYPKP